MNKIAVYSREEKLVPFSDCNRATIYEKQEDTWKPIKAAVFPSIKGTTVKELREAAEKAAVYAEDARAIICKEMTGIPFTVFNKKGYGIFCTEEANEVTFEGVIADMEESDEKRRMREEMLLSPGPVETSTPGIYYLNLLDLQKECPDISSKKALASFLSDTPFLELHLVCAHIPPWLLMDPSYEKKIHPQEGVEHITVTKKHC
jgi:hypothetical protein